MTTPESIERNARDNPSRPTIPGDREWLLEVTWLCATHQMLMPPWPGKEPRRCAYANTLERMTDFIDELSPPQPCGFRRVRIVEADESESV